MKTIGNKQLSNRSGKLLLAMLLILLTAVMVPQTAAASAGSFQVEKVPVYKGYTTSRVNIRTGPGQSYNVIETLDIGTEVTVSGEYGRVWLQVKTAEIPEGYVFKKYVTEDKSAVPPHEETAETEDSKEEETSDADTVEASDETEVTEAAEETEEQTEETPEEAPGSGETADQSDEKAEISETAEAADSETAAAAEDGSHKHEYKENVIKEATCSSFGEAEYTCTICGDSYTEKIPRTEHKMGSFVVAEEPGWFTPGVQYQTCSICGTTLVSEEIPANPMPFFLILGGILAVVAIVIVVLVMRARSRSSY
ncbi:MAG: SH3 domain-containing protein [Lachnospiraceae bacterium]|nr:SH3 domain-containing protein [Lachnospiraceae bacterium]